MLQVPAVLPKALQLANSEWTSAQNATGCVGRDIHAKVFNMVYSQCCSDGTPASSIELEVAALVALVPADLSWTAFEQMWPKLVNAKAEYERSKVDGMSKVPSAVLPPAYLETLPPLLSCRLPRP